MILPGFEGLALNQTTAERAINRYVKKLCQHGSLFQNVSFAQSSPFMELCQ